MAEHAIGRPGHCMGTDEEDRITALLKRGDVACPGIAEDILCAGFQAFRKKALKAVCSPGTVAINYDDLACSCCASTAYSSIHFVGVEFSALCIESGTTCHLFPVLNARDAFHIAEDNNTHKILAFKYFVQPLFCVV